MKTNYILVASAVSAMFTVSYASADTVVQKGAQVTQYNNASSVNNQSNGTATTVSGSPAAAQQALSAANLALRQAQGGSTSGPSATGLIVRPGMAATSPTSAGTNHVINWHSTRPASAGTSNGTGRSGSGRAQGTPAVPSGTVVQKPATVDSSNVSTQVTCSPSCTTTTSSSPSGTSTMIVSNTSNNAGASAPSAASIQSQVQAIESQAFQQFGGWHQ